MDGFIEYLIVSNKEIEREIEREKLCVEVPFMKENFTKWLKCQGKSDGTIYSYISNLKTMDRHIFLFEKDFFAEIENIIRNNRTDEINVLFDKYERLISEIKNESIKDNGGYTTKRIGDWISTIRSYKKFFIELLSNKKKDEFIKVEKSIKIPFEEKFIEYVEESKSSSTANQYVSYLKRLNKDFFVKVYKTDIFVGIVNLIRNSEATLDYITTLQLRLKDISKKGIESYNINQHSFDNCRSAFSCYAEFISELLANNFTSETYTEKSSTTTNIKEEYDRDPIFNNFKFRLRTQDRLSHNKNVFFPIRMISKLFRLRNKQLKTKENFFEKWLEGSINNIHLLTEMGYVCLSEVKYLEIIPNKAVYALLKNDTKVDVYTHTADNKIKLLSVDKLKNIHIDHTPLINNVLESNKDKLPALIKLTEDIKRYSIDNNVEIARGNFIKIFNGIINSYDIDFIISITSELEHDLDFIRQNTTLELMDAEENLKKKC